MGGKSASHMPAPRPELLDLKPKPQLTCQGCGATLTAFICEWCKRNNKGPQ